MYGKSLSVGPCEVSCIDLTIKVQSAKPLPIILIVTFFTCRCWSTTTRKERMYKMYEMYVQDVQDVRDIRDVCMRCTRCMYEIYKMYEEV